MPRLFDPIPDIPLWPAEPPLARPEDASLREHALDDTDAVLRLTDVSRPTLSLYPATGLGPRPCVLVVPGGGYSILAWNHEGTDVVHWLLANNVSAALLKYRVPDRADAALADAFGSRDLPAARAALRNLLSQKVDEVFLLIVLENRLNEISLVVDARERGLLAGSSWSPALDGEDRAAVADLGKYDVLARPGFMKARIVAQANKWTRAQTVRARLAVMRAHENAVTVSLNPATLLELALAEALA